MFHPLCLTEFDVNEQCKVLERGFGALCCIVLHCAVEFLEFIEFGLFNITSLRR